MKILLLDKNTDYAHRLSEYMHDYSAQMQIISFTDLGKMLSYLEEQYGDMVICARNMGYAEKQELHLPSERLPFVWLTEKDEAQTDGGTLMRYQSISQIYHHLCDLYEAAYNRTIHRTEEIKRKGASETVQIVTFFPVHGGAGSSSMAMACAVAFSRKQRVLYINMEEFPGDDFFEPSGFTVGDLVTELCGSYTQQSLKGILENMPAHYNEQLSYFSGSLNPDDLEPLSDKKFTELAEVLRREHLYDMVIIDASMVTKALTKTLICQSDKLVFTLDGSKEAFRKYRRVGRYVQLAERERSASPAKQYLIYNKAFSDSEQSEYTGGAVRAASFPRYKTQNNMRLQQRNLLENIGQDPRAFEKIMD